jgi:OOP family OmpA-OmpF porin
MKKLLFALIASATVAGSAQAQQGRTYVGLGLTGVDHEFVVPGGTIIDADEWKWAIKLYGGYEIDDMWAAEAGYVGMRSASADYQIGGTTGTISSDGRRFYLAGKAKMPINQMFSVYGKLGLAHVKAEQQSAIAALSRDETDVELYASIGGQFNLTPHMAIVAEYERYGGSTDFGAEADMVTIGAHYKF